MRQLYNGYDLVTSSALPHCKYRASFPYWQGFSGCILSLWERDVYKVTEQPLFAGSLKLAGTSMLAGWLP